MPSRDQPRAADETALLVQRAAIERRSPRARPLTSKPQPLGILPSLWFWQALWKTEPQLHMFFTLLWTTVNAPLVFLIVMYLRPFWLAMGAMILVPVVSMGLAERALRLLVARRRRLLSAGLRTAPRELPTGGGAHCSDSGDERR